MILFCCICKRHIEVADTRDPADAIKAFRSLGHDDSKTMKLRRGLVGVYGRDVPEPNLDDIPAEIVECFENEKRVAA